MALLDMLQQRLGSDAVNQISSRIGADPGTTGNAIDAALPLLISALAQNAGAIAPRPWRVPPTNTMVASWMMSRDTSVVHQRSRVPGSSVMCLAEDSRRYKPG
jgi:hypothetical protein